MTAVVRWQDVPPDQRQSRKDLEEWFAVDAPYIDEDQRQRRRELVDSYLANQVLQPGQCEAALFEKARGVYYSPCSRRAKIQGLCTAHAKQAGLVAMTATEPRPIQVGDQVALAGDAKAYTVAAIATKRGGQVEVRLTPRPGRYGLGWVNVSHVRRVGS